MRKIRNDGYYWRSGGGTWVAGGGKKAAREYPSDDHFDRADGGSIVVLSTMERHFKMPSKVRSARELRRLSGVGKVTTLRPGASDAALQKAYTR